MNLKTRLERLENKVKSPVYSEYITNVSGHTTEELTQNALNTIREAEKTGRGWNNLAFWCSEDVDTASVILSIEREFGRRPEQVWVIPLEAVPEGW